MMALSIASIISTIIITISIIIIITNLIIMMINITNIVIFMKMMMVFNGGDGCSHGAAHKTLPLCQLAPRTNHWLIYFHFLKKKKN